MVLSHPCPLRLWRPGYGVVLVTSPHLTAGVATCPDRAGHAREPSLQPCCLQPRAGLKGVAMVDPGDMSTCVVSASQNGGKESDGVMTWNALDTLRVWKAGESTNGVWDGSSSSVYRTWKLVKQSPKLIVLEAGNL